MVAPEYFNTFGIRIVRGRALTAQDGAGGQRVAVVNERFVKRFLDGRDPMNERVAMNQFVPRTANLSFGPGAPGSAVEWHIVGVFRDISDLEPFGDPAAPQIYVPFAQSPWPQPMMAIRSCALEPSSQRRRKPAYLQRGLWC